MNQAALNRTARGAVVRLALGPALGVLAGCTAHTPATAPDTDLIGATAVVENIVSQAPPPVAELVSPDDADIQAAMRVWKSGQEAPIIRTTGFIQYPYGLTEAIVTCEPLRLCDVELEAGEEIQNVSIGDSGRWSVSAPIRTASRSGERQTTNDHAA